MALLVPGPRSRTTAVLDWQGPFIYFTRGSGQTDWHGKVVFRVPSDGGPEERLLELPVNCEDVSISRDA